MVGGLLQEDSKTLSVRRRMVLEKVMENELIPLIKECDDTIIFSKAIRLMANLTQPLDKSAQIASPDESVSTTSSSLGTSATSQRPSLSPSSSPTSTHPTSSPSLSSSVSPSSSPSQTEKRHAEVVSQLINTAKLHCSDLDFCSSLGSNMRGILCKETLKTADCVGLNHCILLLRNLFHIRSGTASDEEASISHQCLISSFFVTELDKVIFEMLNHKLKETWAIGLAQLISFLFKDYSASLLEPDLDEVPAPVPTKSGGASSSQGTTSSSNGSHRQSRATLSSHGRARGAVTLGSNLTSTFKENLQIRSATEHFSSCSSGSEEDDFLLEFKSTRDGRLEIKLTNCPHQSASSGSKESSMVTNEVNRPSRSCGHASGGSGSGSGGGRSVEDMDVLEAKGSSGSGSSNKEGMRCKDQESDLSSCRMSGQSGEQASGESSPVVDEDESPKVTTTTKDGDIQEDADSGGRVCCTSRMMDMDIIVSYLKKFATEIMYSGFVGLVENIMRALMTKYDAILDHSFLMWTVGFFLSFAHQQELDFSKFKEVLNLDLIGYLVYEAIISCEAMEVKRINKQEMPVEKHRVHLVVCTLNQLFRTLMTHSKMDYLVDLQKCLVHMTDLHQLFVLLIRQQESKAHGIVYLRDLVQTNHVLILMLEEWLARGFVDDASDFSMLDHIRQFATRPVMAKYGSLLEQTELSRDTVNVAVLTMMYHVAGDCKRQDTLMQIPILKAFSEIWMQNAISDHVEFNDLVEFVLEMFMSYAENDPTACANKLMDGQACEQAEDNNATDDGGGGGSGSGSTGNGSRAGDAESSMNVGSSNCSSLELSDEEQNLIFTWMTDLEGDDSEKITELVCQKLREHGFCRTKEQVSKYLQDNGFIDQVSSSVSPYNSSNSSEHSSPSASAAKKDQMPSSSSSSSPERQSLDKSNRSCSSSRDDRQPATLAAEDDNLIPLLSKKLKAEGLEPQLKWLQKQLLEAAYVKLVLEDSSQRTHLEEPVAKFHAIQNKAIPLVAWNDDLEAALNHPYCLMLQRSLGLITHDRADILFPRIPAFFTPSMLVNKASQLGPLESTLVKFDVESIKKDCSTTSHTGTSTHNGDMPKTSGVTTHVTGACGRSMESSDQMWLNLIQKMNGDMDVGSN
ncbi:timeless [Elysia marginata]|uniref:Timeless n=1 Tax=Elysia marginata TaxID=1093978 RepID=A0AAV4ISM2_9GAST|nr:timeless [Elysia marginata]